MRCNKYRLAAQHMRLHLMQVVGPYPGAGVLQALAAGWRHVVGTAPDMDLLLAPLPAGVILVQAVEIAIVTLVEGLVPNGLQIALTCSIKNVLAGILRADQR